MAITPKKFPNNFLNLSAFTILALNMGLALIYTISWFIAGSQDLFWRADFSMFYTGGTIVRENHGDRLYDLDLQAETQQRILDGRSFSEGLLPFDYPPYVSILFAPLTKLPLSQSFMVWTGIQVGFLVCLIRILLRLMADWTRRERWLAISSVLAFPPMFVNFLLGALSLLMMLSIVQIYLSLKSINNNKSAFWWLVSFLKPTFMVFPGIVLLASRRWKALWMAALGGILVFIASSSILGFHIWPEYVSQILQISNYYGVHGFHPELMPNIRGTLTLLLGEGKISLVNSVSLFFLVVGIIASLFIWNGEKGLHIPDLELRMAGTIMLIPLLSLHAYTQDTLVVIVAAFLAYKHIRVTSGRHRSLIPLFLIYPSFVLISDFVVGDQFGIRLPVIAMILFTAWLFKALADGRNSKAKSCIV